MGASNFEDLARHAGHRVVVATYGKEEPVNVAVECEDCGEVLFDYDKYPEEEVRVQ